MASAASYWLMKSSFRARLLLAPCLLWIALPAPGRAQAELFIHNFHRVDDNVLRGAQPDEQGLRALAALHVKTVVDLREADERGVNEKKLVESLGMHYVGVPLNGLKAPKKSDIDKALATLLDRDAGPVFVHCKYGRDRTGTVIAAYRVEHDRWPNAKALKEAESDGLHVYEWGMKRFILGLEPPAAEQTPAK